MKRNAKLIFSISAIAIAMTGCQSHLAKIDVLQKEHDRISQQYKKDCGDQYLKAEPEFNQKCIDEAKQMDDLWKQIQAEKSK